MTNFVDSPLVTWVKTFGPLGSGCEDKLSMFMDLVDGVFLHKIMTHIDPSPTNQRVNKQVNNDVNLRIQNLKILLRHVKSYYQENLQQLILMNLPNILNIAKDPLSGKSMDELRRLLLLILGCAVQCERKEEIIERIKLLDIETQAAIVSHIQEVTHNQENVLDLQWLEAAELPVEELDPLSRSMAGHLRKLVDERDERLEMIVELTQERDYLQTQQPFGSPGFPSPERQPSGPRTSNLTKEERQHLGVELADTKAKLRRSRQELEEKTEQLLDSKNEVERLDSEMQKLRQENMQLLSEARSVRAYRDEVDSLRERASRVDRLETELSRCKEKLQDIHFYKNRVEELREDNVTLMETKCMLEEQLSASRGRCDKLHELEKENLQLRSKLHDVELDRDTDKRRLEELVEENMLLEISQKQSMNESAHLGWELEQLAKNNDVNEARKSFVLELNESACSRLLKLEKENQGLQSTIQQLRQEALALEEGQLHTLELERENQSLSKKLERLQTQLDQEKQNSQDMEQVGEELLKDRQKLEKNLESLQADKDKQVLELEQEKEHLTQAVSSLRHRAQANSEARVREVEQENRALHQTISETGTRLARLEAERRQATKELEHLRERGERCEDLEREVSRLERSREQLQREVAALKISCDRVEALEREHATLEQDNRRLKKQADSAQNTTVRLGVLEKEHQQLDQENLDLRKQVDALRPAAVRVEALQQENAELEREREDLGRALEELRPLVKRSERLESSCASLTQENLHLHQNLNTSSSRVQGLERELRHSESQAQKLRRELEDEARPTAKRAQTLEEEKRGLQQELSQTEKERRQLEKETRRLRLQLEAKESELDDSGLRLMRLEKESSALSKEASRLKEAAGRAKELERENKDLQKQATIDKKTLATLREDLVNEKLKVQQQINELEKLSHELENIGLNREKLLQEEHSSEDNKYKILETKIESTLKQTLKLREEKIQSLESRLEESGNLNLELRTELSTVKKTLEALRQRHEEEAAHSKNAQDATGQSVSKAGQEKWDAEQRETTGQLLKLKDRLIEVEKSVGHDYCEHLCRTHFVVIVCCAANAALQTEKQLLKEQQKQLDSQNSQLHAQTLALQRQAAALQEHNTALHTQAAKLQVESSTLNSQSASLMTQNALLQGQVQSLEGEVEVLQREREETRVAQERALQEHEKLLSVHDRQSREYEELISQHASLKSTQRALEQEHRVLENKYMMILKQKDSMEELQVELQRERENLREEIQKNSLARGENHSLREEMDQLLLTHEHLSQEYDGLQLQTKELKTSLNATQLELNRWQAQYDQLKEQHQGLDLSMTKLDTHCELLNRLKGNLEEENHHLLSQVQILSQQNQTLLERTMESKELYHEEQKQYIDKLNELRRQKEKLEEKIMDQYKFYDPTPKKRNHWSGAKVLAKLIKPKKEAPRERERQRSAPDLPLPDPPPPDCPEGAPPLPPRQPRLSLDSNDSQSTEENNLHSPLLKSALNSAENPTYSSSSVHSNSGEMLAPPIPAPVSFTPPCPTSSSLFSGCRPNASDFSLNVSGGNSPVNSRGSLERPQPRSASLSSDDVALGGHDLPHRGQSPGLPRSSTLPYDPPAHRSAPHGSSRHRAPSPGSEMVTLEEFLQESNTLSPPTVQTGSHEDLMNDYFSRSRDGAKTPTSYVTPTIKCSQPGDDGRPHTKPGHSVKPSVRQPSEAPPTQSQTLPGRGLPSPHQHGSSRGGAGGAGGGLSRTFSLASADLLRSSGPECYRGNASPSQTDGVVRRGTGGGATRERPLSARITGSSPQLAEAGHLDSRRLSVAPSREDASHSSSLSLKPEGYRASPAAGQQGRSLASQPHHQHHRGEVAMVTPVRAVSALRLDEKVREEYREQGEAWLSDTPLTKQEAGRGGGGPAGIKEEQPKSTPASPDPNNDPQTVWYEYGCV
uniref:Calponin-homology (CH) domain-containing protein n=1 Tax=Denticeps clupeoides TaxID=299321 RepID=A0AAY4B8G7_9TELE